MTERFKEQSAALSLTHMEQKNALVKESEGALDTYRSNMQAEIVGLLLYRATDLMQNWLMLQVPRLSSLCNN